jgi:hypothetical protein
VPREFFVRLSQPVRQISQGSIRKRSGHGCPRKSVWATV